MTATHSDPFCRPFGEFYFPAAGHEEAAARVLYVAEAGRFGLMSGPAGVGKSLVLSLAADELRRSRRTVLHADLTGVCDRASIRRRVAAAAGTTPNCLEDVVRGAAAFGTVVLMLDHVAPAADVTEALSIFREAAVVAAGDWDAGGRADLVVPVPPLREDETAGYLLAGLEDAGRNDRMFDAAAAARIHDLSGGLPRSVDRIARLAVVAADADAEPVIGPATIEAVRGELPPAAHAA